MRRAGDRRAVGKEITRLLATLEVTFLLGGQGISGKTRREGGGYLNIKLFIVQKLGGR